ncbi:MAG: sulfatase-like hydrolase/transferase, partial [Bacteroidota bacterium]
TDWAIDYVDARRGERTPFFLYLAYNAPHFPIQPPPSYVDKVFSRERGIDSARAKNVAFIEHLDSNIGRLMAELEKWQLLENTLIIFSSDNGGATWYAQRNEPMRGAKQQMFEGGIRVPTFAFWKGRIEAGTTDNVGVLMDWMPTLLELVGQPLEGKSDGISLLPTVLGEDQVTNQRYLFWVRREGGRYGGQAYYGARYGDYKILQNSAFEPMQLFKVGADPFETDSLSVRDSKEFQDLKRALQEHIQNTGSIPWQEP